VRQNEKLRSLELGRFLAALLIMCSHVINYIRIDPHVAGHGFLGGFALPQPPGVEYFFVLSGFVMMTAHGHQFGQARAVLPFFWRRICRIYPAYWLALAVTLCLYWNVTSTVHLLRLVTLAPVQTAEYDPVAWTLRYEIAFYLVFGLALLPVVGRVVLWGWIAVILAIWLPPAFGLGGFSQWRFWLATNQVTSLFVYALNALFLGGMAAGWLFLRVQIKPLAALGLTATGCMFLYFAVRQGGFGFSYGSPVAFLWTTSGFGLVMVGLATLEHSGVLRFSGLADQLGKISYPLYISHAVVLTLTDKFVFTNVRPMKAMDAFLTLLGIIAVVALVVTYLFDQPLMNLLRRSRRAPTHQPALIAVPQK
jgi:exopolysaccharide production protein ExoZ